MIRTWAPDDFWRLTQPLIAVPGAAAARRWQAADGRPGGAGRDRLSGAGRLLEAQTAGVAVRFRRATVHRRFTEWIADGLWKWLHQQFLHRLNVISEIDWSRAVVDSISVRALKKG